MPVACSLVAPVFLGLYETWIRALVTGPVVRDAPASHDARRRLIRRVFATEVLLVATFLGLAHALLNLDWCTPGWWPVLTVAAGGGIGVVGCSLALASDLGTTRHKVVPG